MGGLLLAGGAEFGGKMALPDRQAISLAGGPDASIVIVPTAAAPDHNHERAGGNGVRWFRSLGGRNVQLAPLTDRVSAADPGVVDLLQRARLIYLLGGFTRYLVETLRGSPAWAAAQEAVQAGAVIAGSSAGAMALCEYVFDPASGEVIPGLGSVSNACVMPHHDTFGHRWAERLSAALPEAILLGIDERTAMIQEVVGGSWLVTGQGGVTVYRSGRREPYPAGQGFTF
jgi:cyanophycinase